jgi:hypothetical protein
MRRLQQTDPTSWNRAAEQFDPDFIPDPGEVVMAPPERKTTYQYLCDSVLGRSGAAAKFLHHDCQTGFPPAPRAARGTWGAPSPGCRALVARDAAVAASPAGQQILAYMAKEERAAWFDSLKSRLGKHIPGQQPQLQARPQAQTHTSDGDNSTAGYFERLRARLGKL